MRFKIRRSISFLFLLHWSGKIASLLWKWSQMWFIYLYIYTSVQTACRHSHTKKALVWSEKKWVISFSQLSLLSLKIKTIPKEDPRIKLFVSCSTAVVKYPLYLNGLQDAISRTCHFKPCHVCKIWIIHDQIQILQSSTHTHTWAINPGGIVVV